MLFPNVCGIIFYQKTKEAASIKTNKTAQQKHREQIKQLLIQTPGLSDRAVARIAGGSHATVGKVRAELIERGQMNHTDTLSEEWVSHPYLIKNPSLLDGMNALNLRAIKAPGVLDKMQELELTSPRYAQRVLNKETKAARESVKLELSERDFRICQADIADGLPHIKSGSVKLLVTDPPYGREFVPLYGHLSRTAERVLTDGGSLLVLTGQSHLPLIMEQLGSCMSYNWCLAYVMRRGSLTVVKRLAQPGFKPVLWYVKKGANLDNNRVVYDIIHAAPVSGDKDFHEWGQSVFLFEELIKRFTVPGDLVLDPFVGGGSCAVAAWNTQRKFEGSDVSAECAEITHNRIISLFESEKPE